MLKVMDTGGEEISNWFVPLSASDVVLKDARSQLQSFGLKQEEVPLIIQLVENPKYDFPGIDLFHGATGIQNHDCIHVLLGRGILPKDEAFVIGFTMGSSNRVTTTEESLYAFFSQRLYPKDYRFAPEDIEVFRDATKLGYISDCRPLSEVDFESYQSWPIGECARSWVWRKSSCGRITQLNKNATRSRLRVSGFFDERWVFPWG